MFGFSKADAAEVFKIALGVALAGTVVAAGRYLLNLVMPAAATK